MMFFFIFLFIANTLKGAKVVFDRGWDFKQKSQMRNYEMELLGRESEKSLQRYSKFSNLLFIASKHQNNGLKNIKMNVCLSWCLYCQMKSCIPPESLLVLLFLWPVVSWPSFNHFSTSCCKSDRKLSYTLSWQLLEETQERH